VGIAIFGLEGPLIANPLIFFLNPLNDNYPNFPVR
jgi:hypothetical protein